MWYYCEVELELQSQQYTDGNWWVLEVATWEMPHQPSVSVWSLEELRHGLLILKVALSIYVDVENTKTNGSLKHRAKPSRQPTRIISDLQMTRALC